MDALRFCQVAFTYPAATSPVLRDVSWSVPAGSFTLLVGGVGSGKTTLLRCAKPELAPAGKRAGTIEVLGCALEKLDVRTSAAQLGYVAQSPENQIVCDSVWHEMAFGLENLGVAPALMRRRVAETAHFFGIEPWFRRETASLSGGQKQLLNLASILSMQPKVLLLDEPTAQLDPVAAKNFLHALFRINRELGITVVVATHAPETMIDYATSVVRIEGGEVHPEEA
ncbi:MAG: ABC transporter ATP-binding protein, partial [Raoultibacter sp.]